MGCGYECHMIGGPWIAENPHCPIHGSFGKQDREDRESKIRAILESVWYREISADDGYDEIESLL